MKKKITLLLLGASSFFTMNSQLFQENFSNPNNNPNNLVPQGWTLTNNSGNAGQTWFTGNPAVFSAFNGAAGDYVACNWASTTNTVSGETLSNWLITPTVNLVNGAVLMFATRTNSAQQFVDNMEVYFSTAGAGVNVGNTPTSLGTFSNLLIAINPGLTPTGYPGSWTVFTATVTGVPVSTVGKIGFRYYVPNGGFGGANSDFIGLDGVKYSLPCNVTVNSYTVCTGISATLNAVGGATSTTYTWSPGGSNSSSMVVTPPVTTTYTLAYSESGSGCPNQTATVTVGSQLSMSVSASPSNTICSGQVATLTAMSSATTYSWSTGANTSVITVTPNATTVYSVGGLAGGGFPPCVGGNTIQVTVNPSPNLTVSISSPVCVGGSVTINVSGAATYTYAGSSNNPQTIASPTAAGQVGLVIGGTGTNGCVVVGSVQLTVNPAPAITVSASKTLECTNSTVTLTASGGVTYTWSGAGSGSTNPLNYATGATAGIKLFTVTGSDAVGCKSSTTIAISVTACATSTTGINKVNGDSFDAHIYPNPFTNELRLNGLEGTVEIYNALGQLVITARINDSDVINTSELAKGAYILKAITSDGDHAKTIKLLKN